MSPCLENVIGIKHSCEAEDLTPKTGLFINQLEGITFNMSSKIANGEDKTGLNLMREKINFAAGLVADDLRTYVSPYFNLEDKIDYLAAGRWTNDFLDFSDFKRGLVVKKKKRDAQRLYVSRLLLLSNTTATKTVEITDGPFFYEIEVELEAGVERIVDIDYTAHTDTVTILMDNSNVEMNEGKLVRDGYTGCNCTRYKFTSHNHNGYETNLDVTGWNGVSTESRTFGMRVELSVVCDYEALVCMLIPQMKYLFLYRSGIELMKEWLSSERINEFTTINADHAAYLIDRWQKEYDTKFKTFAYSLKSILGRLKDACVNCRGLSFHQAY